MRRRDFITRTSILAAAALTFPDIADAQQQRVIGFLDSGAPANMNTNLAGFRQGLGEMGFIEG